MKFGSKTEPVKYMKISSKTEPVKYKKFGTRTEPVKYMKFGLLNQKIDSNSIRIIAALGLEFRHSTDSTRSDRFLKTETK